MLLPLHLNNLLAPSNPIGGPSDPPLVALDGSESYLWRGAVEPLYLDQDNGNEYRAWRGGVEPLTESLPLIPGSGGTKKRDLTPPRARQLADDEILVSLMCAIMETDDG